MIASHCLAYHRDELSSRHAPQGRLGSSARFFNICICSEGDDEVGEFDPLYSLLADIRGHVGFGPRLVGRSWAPRSGKSCFPESFTGSLIRIFSLANANRDHVARGSLYSLIASIAPRKERARPFFPPWNTLTGPDPAGRFVTTSTGVVTDFYFDRSWAQVFRTL